MPTLANRMRRRLGRDLDRREVRATRPRGVLSLSFDDIPASAWLEGGPVLDQHGVKATYYVCGGLAGGTWEGVPQFTTEHMQALHAAGHEVGCHTYDHLSSLRETGATWAASLDRNAVWVSERLGGHRMETFAYPYGDCVVGAKFSAAKRFACSRGIQPRVNGAAMDRGLLTAVGLEQKRLAEVDFDALMADAAATGGWLILFSHDVSDRPTPYGCTPDQLDRIIAGARAHGLDILPVRDAWRAHAN